MVSPRSFNHWYGSAHHGFVNATDGIGTLSSTNLKLALVGKPTGRLLKTIADWWYFVADWEHA